MSSIASDATSISVSFCGEEMPLEQAIDTVYKDLQNSLNFCHCSTRELNMMAEKDDTEFQVIMKNAFAIDDFIDEMSDLFKELKLVVKQVVGKPQNDDEKEWLKKQKESRKEKKRIEKLRAKEDAARLKAEKDAKRLNGSLLNDFMKKAQV